MMRITDYLILLATGEMKWPQRIGSELTKQAILIVLLITGLTPFGLRFNLIPRPQFPSALLRVNCSLHRFSY
jgi:hypothetical protein